MSFDPFAAPPLLTADLPGVGGRIKAVPEDFEVEEIPAYQPGGTGEHQLPAPVRARWEMSLCRQCPGRSVSPDRHRFRR